MQVFFLSKVCKEKKNNILRVYFIYIYIHTGGNGGAERFDDDCDD